MNLATHDLLQKTYLKETTMSTWQAPAEQYDVSEEDLEQLFVIEDVEKRHTLRELLPLVPALREITETDLELLLQERKIRINGIHLRTTPMSPFGEKISSLDVKLSDQDLVKIGDVEFATGSVLQLVTTFPSKG